MWIPPAQQGSRQGFETAAFSISRPICYLLHTSPSLNWVPGNAKPARAAGFKAGRWENIAPRNHSCCQRGRHSAPWERSLYIYVPWVNNDVVFWGLFSGRGHRCYFLSTTGHKYQQKTISLYFRKMEKFPVIKMDVSKQLQTSPPQSMVNYRKEKHGRREHLTNLMDGATFLLGTAWGHWFIIILNSAFPPVFYRSKYPVTDLIPFSPNEKL